MPAYNAKQFHPPAPTAEVVLRPPANDGKDVTVEMLLDYGSDITLIPQAAAGELDLTPIPDQQYELMGFDGSISSSPIYELQMVFVGKKFRGHYLTIAKEYGILGRNILNHVALLLDGPDSQWQEWEATK